MKEAKEGVIADSIRKSIPEELTPTKRMGVIFGLIFLTGIIISLVNFPLDSFLAGNTDAKIIVGYPFSFLEFDLSEVNKSPLRLGGLILDITIYFLLAYIIGVIMKLLFKQKTKEDKKKHKKIEGDGTIAEEVTRTIFKKDAPKKSK